VDVKDRADVTGWRHVPPARPPGPPRPCPAPGRRYKQRVAQAAEVSPLTLEPQIPVLIDMAYPSPFVRYQWAKVP
jgi:hypothetical protein